MRISDWSSAVCSSDLLVGSDGARHHRMYQLAENLAVDQLEVIQICQLAIVQRLQFLVDLQDLGTPPGKRLEAGLVHAAVFPAAPEYQRPGGRSAKRRVGKECYSTGKSRW